MKNPYESPNRTPPPAGSYGLGVVLGVLLGFWGLLGCHLLGQAETKRGSLHGFLGRLGFVLVLLAVVMVFED